MVSWVLTQGLYADVYGNINKNKYNKNKKKVNQLSVQFKIEIKKKFDKKISRLAET